MPRVRLDNRMRVTFWRMLGPKSTATREVVTCSLVSAVTIAETFALNHPVSVGHVVMVEIRGHNASDVRSSSTIGLHTRYVFDKKNRNWVQRVNMIPSLEVLKRYGHYSA